MPYHKPSSLPALAIFGHEIIFMLMSENGRRGSKNASSCRNEDDERQTNDLFIQNHEVSGRPTEIGRKRTRISGDPVGKRRSETSPAHTADGRQKSSGAP